MKLENNAPNTPNITGMGPAQFKDDLWSSVMAS